MIGAGLRHLARLGGVIVAPRRTLRRVLLEGDGALWEVLPWMVLVTAAVAPTGAGRALLVGRVAALDGVLLFVNLVATRMVAPLIGIVVAAAILAAVSRATSDQPVGFDLALDACAFTLVPFLLLAGVGVLLHASGIELWFMPHRRFTVPGTVGAVRSLVAFAWPAALYLLLLVEVWTRRRMQAESAA